VPASGQGPRELEPMSKPKEIPYSEFQAIEKDLEAGPIGDGLRDGRPFWIQRYTSRTTGKRYDLVFMSGVDKEPRCLEITP
jgi:hypothetical protein